MVREHVVLLTYTLAEFYGNVAEHGVNGIFDPKRWAGSQDRVFAAMDEYKKKHAGYTAPRPGVPATWDGKSMGKDATGGTMLPGLGGVIGFESGGRHNAEHPGTGAYGYSQIMPGNWGAWSAEAGLGLGASMHLPENQRRVTEYKWAQYLNEYKDTRLAAAAWIGGPGAANRLRKGLLKGDYTDVNKVLGRFDANGTTIGQYMQKTQGSMVGPGWAPNLPGGAYGGGDTTINTATINLNGQTTDQQIRQIDEIIRERMGVGPTIQNRAALEGPAI
jgi:hypothetical protein